ncbi:hypothetical protein BH11PAT4_BH11PAT4_7080 [soil metagenome]
MAQADIEKRLSLLEKAEQEYKTKKEMLDDSMRGDGELENLEEKVKDAKKRFLAAKEALMNEPEQRKLSEQLKELAGEIKDTKKLLADELIAYFMANNTLEYIDSMGGKRRIAVSAKFVRGKEEA